MASKMLIDASHPQETRVVVVKGSKVEDFDFESDHKKQIRGNIYLAKVTRVEPSLQAAFVEYGGNRHGFLPFSEIHPDYYQIPVADREALLREYERELADEDADEAPSAAADAAGSDDEDEDGAPKSRRRSRRGGRSRRKKTVDAASEDGADDGDEADADDDEAADVDASADDDASGDDPDTMAAIVETDSVSEDAPDGDGGDGEAGGEEKATRRRSTRRRKAPGTAKADDVADDAAVADDADGAAERSEAAVASSGSDADAPAAKPKRRRSTRRKAAVAEADDGAAAEPVSADEADTDAVDADALALNEAEGGADAGEVVADGDGESGDAAKPKRRSRGTKRRSRKADAEGDADGEARARSGAREANDADAPDGDDDEDVEAAGGDDALEEAPRTTRAPRKHYKIQEVMKRRQIILVQVTKEERGNKGAALTTYLSLAGRYSVLMPNTARGGGISRKIAQATDRKRLKEIAKGLEVPRGMGVILRTAAAARTKQEINRDFDYLMRLWDSVRELTLSSSAPALVYEEGDLIKRSIRDLYRKEIDEIVVAGDRGYREAKDFMRMLMPSQARVVKRWSQPTPILAAHGIEAELDRMLQPEVKLRSGGYIIINQTEALVAIDVNSGRATREHSIESTALQTNLEAAEEIGRQLRLRDLAGLIVIDFIDMDERRNNRSVEKRLKDCLKDDRARIQLGRISSFGLLEMSRQRMRSSVLEATMQPCEHCNGTGHVRSASSIGIQILRAVDEQLRKSPNHVAVVRTTPDLIAHLINVHRAELADVEARHGQSVRVQADASIGTRGFAVERGEFVEQAERAPQLVRQDYAAFDDDDPDEAEPEADASAPDAEEAPDDDDGRKRRRGRRGGRSRRNGVDAGTPGDDAGDDEAPAATSTDAAADPDGTPADDDGDAAPIERPKRKRTRRRKGEDTAQEPDESLNAAPEASGDAATDETTDTEPKRRSTRRRKAPVASAAETAVQADATTGETASATEAEEEAPRRRTRRRTSRVGAAAASETAGADETMDEEGAGQAGDPVEDVAEHGATHAGTEGTEADTASPDEESEDDSGRKKRGWWNRGFF